MPAARIADKFLPAEVADGSVIVLKGATLNGLIRAIRAIEPVSGDNIRTRPLTGRGIAIEGTVGAEDVRRPLQFYQAGAASVGVWPGGVSATDMSSYAGIPSFNSALVSTYPTLTPPDDATTDYYVRATFTDLDLTAVAIVAASSPTDTATISYVPCGSVTMASGVITSLSAFLVSSLYVKKCASGYVWGQV